MPLFFLLNIIHSYLLPKYLIMFCKYGILQHFGCTFYYFYCFCPFELSLQNLSVLCAFYIICSYCFAFSTLIHAIKSTFKYKLMSSGQEVCDRSIRNVQGQVHTSFKCNYGFQSVVSKIKFHANKLFFSLTKRLGRQIEILYLSFITTNLNDN